MLLNGCIDTQHVLIQGTPDLSGRQHVDLETMMPAWVCLLTSTTTAAGDAVENVIAMYEAIREYGSYR